MTAPQYVIPVMDIYHGSIVDGVGVRSVLFVAGCPHHCKGCHNPESWVASNGTLTNIEDIFLELTSDQLANGVTFSGGEPMMYAKQLIPLAKRIKEETNLNIWCWSGWTYEELIENKYQKELLKYIDVLVDGKFVLELRDITENNMWRGSTNQRVLKLEYGTIIEQLYK